MSRKSATHKRSMIDTVAQRADVQVDTAPHTESKLMTILERAVQEILVATYWFEPAQQPDPYPVTVRFSGRRVDVKGRLSSGDRFTQDETIEQVIPGTGPVAVTARVRNVNPGKWIVTAQELQSAPAYKTRKSETAATVPVPSGPMMRFWHKWAPSVEVNEHVKTCSPALARVPGLFPGIWGALATLGIVIAVLLQFLIIARNHLVLDRWWVVSLGGILVGIIGAKMWYIVEHRREHLFNGWCIQGFISGATLTAALLLVVFRIPAGVFLDVTAPGLLLAMAVGRVGCFFAGCCGGPPTASRWGLWSSDQRVGTRRIPTQLMESLLALSLGVATLAAVLGHGPTNGAYFVGGLAAYTLVRQGILLLRAERRKTGYGGLLTAILAALVLVAAMVFLIR